MAKPNLQVLDYLHEKGVGFVKDGNANYFVGREEVEQFLDDPDALFARFNGVTKFEYRDWREAGGCVRCTAILRSGKQCSRIVKNGTFLTAQQWLDRQKEYCVRHNEGTVSGMRGLAVRAS